MKKHLHILACVLLLLPLTLLGLNLQEDDLVFDDVGEDNDNNVMVGPVLINHRTSHGRFESLSRRNSFRMVEKARSIPDVIVPVGHVFKMKISRPTFSGNVDFYEVRWPSITHIFSNIFRLRSWNMIGRHHFGLVL